MCVTVLTEGSDTPTASGESESESEFSDEQQLLPPPSDQEPCPPHGNQEPCPPHGDLESRPPPSEQQSRASFNEHTHEQVKVCGHVQECSCGKNEIELSISSLLQLPFSSMVRSSPHPRLKKQWASLPEAGSPPDLYDHTHSNLHPSPGITRRLSTPIPPSHTPPSSSPAMDRKKRMFTRPSTCESDVKCLIGHIPQSFPPLPQPQFHPRWLVRVRSITIRVSSFCNSTTQPLLSGKEHRGDFHCCCLGGR